MAGKLAPSLKRVFVELDMRWPHRDRRTDGWYASPSTRKSKGHNPGHNGYSHAIDVDKDGIDPMWIIRHITKADNVLWYIIWNRHLYSNTYNWVEKPYHGENPHTDHMHIEIYQTDFAEKWPGGWGIASNDFEQPPHGPGPTPPGGGDVYEGDFGSNYGGRDYRGYLTSVGTAWSAETTRLGTHITALRNLRK